MADLARLRELEKLVKEAEQRADQAEQRAGQIRPTTLEEYLVACHDSVFARLRVETDPKLTTRCLFSNPRPKWCPTALKPWTDFIELQRATFDALYEAFPPGTRVFESRAFLDCMGSRVARRSMAGERTLRYLIRISIEDSVQLIYKELQAVDKVRTTFQLGNNIILEDSPHNMSEVSDEVIENEAPSTSPLSSIPHLNLERNQPQPDHICIYRSDGETPGSIERTIAFVCGYKPPHKLTAPHLRLGLKPMDIQRHVVDRKTIPDPADQDARFQYNAEKLTVSALTQIYHYMIEDGLEYGLLTTGEAMVFLKIDWEEPGVLLYHLAEAGAETLAHPDQVSMCTAVGQYLAFSLVALRSLGRQSHGQDERRRATEKLKTWVDAFDTTLQAIPVEERRAPKISPGHQPVAYKRVYRSPCHLRGNRPTSVPDEPIREQTTRDPGYSSHDDAKPRLPDTPSPVERQENRRSGWNKASPPQGGGGEGGQGSDERERRYCTQKCLLGLCRGHLMDPKCPNVALHRGHGDEHHQSLGTSPRDSSARHPIDHAQFLDLLREQLKRSLDDGFTPLQLDGARGALFQVTLLAHGYTFVSKGTVRAFVKHLEHEASIYKRLEAMQGKHIPVFLGAIDLRSLDRVFYYDHRVYVIHLTFLTWGGHDVNRVAVPGKQLEQMAMQSLHAVHGAGVAHEDVRASNMLFNEEVNGVMMIDFERASLRKAPEMRTWTPETTDDGRSFKIPRDRDLRAFLEDILAVGGVMRAHDDILKR